MIPGIDVSNHQKAIDWDAVAASGCQFAIAKASEGTGYTDPWFARNWQAAKAVGLVRGAYHYGRPSQNDPEEEADFFLGIVRAQGIEQGDLLVLDMEDTAAGNVLDWTLRFMRHVAAAVGFRPLLYSGKWYMGQRGLFGNDALSEYGLWLAEYDNTFPTPPPNWAFVAMWQYSSTGQTPGVQGNCDLDWFNGDIEQLRRYGMPVPAEPGPVPVGEIRRLVREAGEKLAQIDDLLPG